MARLPFLAAAGDQGNGQMRVEQRLEQGAFQSAGGFDDDHRRGKFGQLLDDWAIAALSLATVKRRSEAE